MHMHQVFLKYFHVERLTQVLANYDRSAINVQRVVKGWLARKKVSLLRFEKKVQAAIKIQSGVLYFGGIAIHLQSTFSDHLLKFVKDLESHSMVTMSIQIQMS